MTPDLDNPARDPASAWALVAWEDSEEQREGEMYAAIPLAEEEEALAEMGF